MGLTKEEFFSEDINFLAHLFRVLSHPCRIRIIITLLAHHSRTVGELSAEFAGPAQSSLSEHLRQLKEAGWINGQRIDNTIRYALRDDVWRGVKAILTSVGSDDQTLLSLAQ